MSYSTPHPPANADTVPLEKYLSPGEGLMTRFLLRYSTPHLSANTDTFPLRGRHDDKILINILITLHYTSSVS